MDHPRIPSGSPLQDATKTTRQAHTHCTFLRKKLTSQPLAICQCAIRPPCASLSSLIRLGKSLQRPSTSSSALTSSQQRFKRAPYCSRVSSQLRCGLVLASRSLIQDTAVSCSRTSCMFPGCACALSPRIPSRRCSSKAFLKGSVILPVAGK